MSTMEATAGHSKACCNVPPVVESGYEKKGTYEEVGGYKTCTYSLYPFFLFSNPFTLSFVQILFH